MSDMQELRREPPQQRDRAALALLVAMVMAGTVSLGAIVGSVGSGAMQSALRTMGFGRDTVIQAEQRRQAASIAEIDAMLRDLNAAVGAVRTSAAQRDEATGARLATIDESLGLLKTNMSELRTAQQALAKDESWRKPMDLLIASVAKARGDVILLRASLDDLEHAYRADRSASRQRIDRLEQVMVQKNLRGSLEEGQIQVRPLTLQETTPAELRNGGHILRPAPGAQ
jgi:hypothetical protein